MEWPDQGVRPHKESACSYPGISISGCCTSRRAVPRSISGPQRSTASAAAERGESPFSKHQNPRPRKWPDQGVRPHKYPPLKNQSHFAGCSTDRRSNYFFFSFGPCTARFLFFFWKKKRKWGVQWTIHRWYPFSPARKGEQHPPLCKSAIIAILSIEGDHT